jgi:hypothetical protein
MNLPSRSPADSIVETVVEFWKRRIALLVSKRVNVGMNICIKLPCVVFGMSRSCVRPVGDGRRLTPYRPELCRDYKCSNVKEDVGERDTVALGDHDCITSVVVRQQQRMCKEPQKAGHERR